MAVTASHHSRPKILITDPPLSSTKNWRSSSPTQVQVANSRQEDELIKLVTGADVVIEAAGLPDLERKGMQMLRPKGAMLQLGINPREVTYDIYGLMSYAHVSHRSLGLRGSSVSSLRGSGAHALRQSFQAA